MADKKKQKKPLCPKCGGTGLKDDPDKGTACCDCPAGHARNSTDVGTDYFG